MLEKKSDQEYINWISANPNGFVLATDKPNHIRLHYACCGYISNKPAHGDHWITSKNRKVCSVTPEDLKDWGMANLEQFSATARPCRCCKNLVGVNWPQLADQTPKTFFAYNNSLPERERRFVKTEVRPEQQAFRVIIFRAYGGRCAISDCDIPETLEAAHFHGKIWRDGDNQASDGILLRRDLHALYDAKLLAISGTGIVNMSDQILHYFGQFHNLTVRQPV